MAPNPTHSYPLGINLTVASSERAGIVTITNRSDGSYIQKFASADTSTNSQATFDLNNLKKSNGDDGSFEHADIIDITVVGDYFGATTHTVDTTEGGAQVTLAGTAVTTTTHTEFRL